MELREHNKIVLENLIESILENSLSMPLLVSTNESYISNLENNKTIFYIGQETNGWCNRFNQQCIEDVYYNFLNNNATNKEYWKFLRNIIGEEKNKFDNVIWSNALICGKSDGLGTPNVDDILLDEGLKNLLFLYNLFKPDMTVIVSGPKEPYYEVIKEFLKGIKSNISGLYPSIKDMLVSDEDKNIHYTYHPNYLNRKHKLLELSQNLNMYYKKP